MERRRVLDWVHHRIFTGRDAPFWGEHSPFVGGFVSLRHEADFPELVALCQRIGLRYGFQIVQVTGSGDKQYPYLYLVRYSAGEEAAFFQCFLDIMALPHMQLSIGVSFGVAAFYEYGDKQHRVAFGVIGEQTNVAARLMQIAEESGQGCDKFMVISRSLYKFLPPAMTHHFFNMGEVSLKNVKHPVWIYGMRQRCHPETTPPPPQTGFFKPSIDWDTLLPPSPDRSS